MRYLTHVRFWASVLFCWEHAFSLGCLSAEQNWDYTRGLILTSPLSPGLITEKPIRTQLHTAFTTLVKIKQLFLQF